MEVGGLPARATRGMPLPDGGCSGFLAEGPCRSGPIVRCDGAWRPAPPLYSKYGHFLPLSFHLFHLPIILVSCCRCIFCRLPRLKARVMNSCSMGCPLYQSGVAFVCLLPRCKKELTQATANPSGPCYIILGSLAGFGKCWVQKGDPLSRILYHL